MRKIFIVFILGLSFHLLHGQMELKESYSKGVKQLQSQDYKNSVTTFSEILLKATDNGLKKTCYIYRGLSFKGLGEFQNAISDFDNAIKIDPSDLASFTDRGIVKISSKDYEGAKKDFLHVLTKDSIDNQGQAALYYLGRIAYLQAKYEQSIKYYDKLILLTPKDAELYFNRGAAKDMIMDSPGSIKDYDLAILYSPEYKEAYANRGVAKINLLRLKGDIKLTKKQTTDACQDLKKAKQLGDNSVDDMLYIHCDGK
jgi:tetratricopeptide (TPR) repeat protein